MAGRAPFDLMVIVDPRAKGVLDGLARLSAHASGDRIAVQLRAKDASEATLIALAREVAAMQPAMSRLLINGSAIVAHAIAADGVHLPELGAEVAAVREQLARGALVGCSCHDEMGVSRRAAQGADYLLLGPLGEVPGKRAIDRGVFTAIARASGTPIVALGGLASERDADDAIALGAAAIAIERALLEESSPAWLAHWLARRATV